MLIVLLIKIQGITIKHLFIKGGVMIGLGFHILFSYLNKEVACNQIKFICVVFWPGLVNFMTSSSFSCANSANSATDWIGLGCHTLFSYLNKEVAWPSG